MIMNDLVIKLPSLEERILCPHAVNYLLNSRGNFYDFVSPKLVSKFEKESLAFRLYILSLLLSSSKCARCNKMLPPLKIDEKIKIPDSPLNDSPKFREKFRIIELVGGSLNTYFTILDNKYKVTYINKYPQLSRRLTTKELYYLDRFSEGYYGLTFEKRINVLLSPYELKWSNGDKLKEVELSTRVKISEYNPQLVRRMTRRWRHDISPSRSEREERRNSFSEAFNIIFNEDSNTVTVVSSDTSGGLHYTQ